MPAVTDILSHSAAVIKLATQKTPQRTGAGLCA
jgi:hypothetical protein